MEARKQLSFNLFALTGLGNAALQYLYDNNMAIKALYTRAESGRYPYGDTEHIYNISKDIGLQTFFIANNGDWSVKDNADVNLVCTFHRILQPKHLEKSSININIHPGELPIYAGRNPFAMMVNDRVSQVAIHVHHMTNIVDTGIDLFVAKYKFKPTNEPELRRFVCDNIGEIMYETIERIYRMF